MILRLVTSRRDAVETPAGPAALFDLAAFPLARIRMPESGTADYGARWVAEFDAILARETRFVLFSVGPVPEDEAHEDRKMRTLWMKRRRGELGRLCLAHLHVEPDSARHEAMQDRTAKMAAFPYPLELFADEDAALERAWSLLRAVPLTL